MKNVYERYQEKTDDNKRTEVFDKAADLFVQDAISSGKALDEYEADVIQYPGSGVMNRHTARLEFHTGLTVHNGKLMTVARKVALTTPVTHA